MIIFMVIMFVIIVFIGIYENSHDHGQDHSQNLDLFYFHKLFAFLFLRTQMIFEIKSLSRPIHVLCVSFTQLILGQF